VGFGLSRLAPFALLAVVEVNHIDERRFGAANAPF
jgi:bifunctional ADP-heptose synthase (sugar kinase/adenylyltransferase)